MSVLVLNISIVSYNTYPFSTSCVCTYIVVCCTILYEISQLLNTAIILLFYSLHQRTPLHIAVKEGHDDTVKCLIEQGARIEAQDNAGVSISISLGQVMKRTGTFYHMYDVKVKHNFFKWDGLSWMLTESYSKYGQYQSISRLSM